MPKTHFHKKNHPTRVKDIFIHQRKMSRLRKGLFLIAVLGGVGFLLLPKGVRNLHWIEKKEPKSRTLLASKHSHKMQEAQDFQKEMLSPVFKGQDAQNRPFEVTADYAQEASNGDMDLMVPRGEIQLEGGNSFSVAAEKGKFTHHREKLLLQGQVIVTYGTCKLETQEAEADLSLGMAKGVLDVHTVCPGIDIQAKGFSVDQKKGIFTYTGRPRVIFTKSAS